MMNAAAAEGMRRHLISRDKMKDEIVIHIVIQMDEHIVNSSVMTWSCSDHWQEH